MGWLSWILRRPNFHRIDDSYAMDRQNLWPSLKTAISHQLQQGHPIWIVVHFAETFTTVQDLLGQWSIDYQIVDQVLQPKDALDHLQDSAEGVSLVLSDLLTVSETANLTRDDSQTLSMIVVERHPLAVQDREVEQFARLIPCPVQLGYFLAIDDLVIRQVVNQTTIEILKQLGMKDHELITSNMITRRINQFLNRAERHYISNQRVPIRRKNGWS